MNRPAYTAARCAVLALVVICSANAQVQVSPPHIVRIADNPGYATLPDGMIVILPVGTTIPATHLTYNTSSRVTDIHTTAEIFSDGFE